MLLSEAKEQAQVLLNEAFYAYHAHKKLINKMHLGSGGWGGGVYLLASADPNYKGTPNGNSWMVPNRTISFGPYVYKCLIPGALDETVLPYKNFTFYGISKGKIKSFADIEPWLKKHNAPDKLFAHYNSIKKILLDSYENLDITQYIERIRKNPISESNKLYTITILQNIIKYMNNHILPRSIGYLHAQSSYSPNVIFYHFAKNKFNKAWKIIDLIHRIEDTREVKPEELLKYYTKLLEETKNVLNLDDSYVAFVRSRCIHTANCENNIELIQTVISYIFAEKLDLVLRGINYYFEKAKKWFMDNYVLKNFLICQIPPELYGFKDFLRKFNIIGFYFDRYGETEVYAEEIIIFDPRDVEIKAVKYIGDWALDRYNNEEPTWDENGYPLEKQINYNGSDLPEGNKWFTPDEYEGVDHEEYAGDKMTPVDPRIEDRYHKNNAQYLKDNHPNTMYYPKSTIHYTTKNPHSRSGSWSWQQPVKKYR